MNLNLGKDIEDLGHGICILLEKELSVRYVGVLASCLLQRDGAGPRVSFGNLCFRAVVTCPSKADGTMMDVVAACRPQVHSSPSVIITG